MINSTSSETRLCPQCGAVIPAGPGWSMWCEACNWNLEGVVKPGASVAKSRSERRAQRRAERLHQQMTGDPADRRRHSAARRMTFLMAVIVHLPAIAVLFSAGTILKVAGL